MMYEWYFYPDEDDINRCKGGFFACRSGYEYSTPALAMYHGKKWMKECNRTGEIRAIPSKSIVAEQLLHEEAFERSEHNA